MVFTISYQEIAEIGNYFVKQGEEDNDQPDISIFAERNGISLLIKDIDVAFFKIKKKIRLGIMDYTNGQVVIKVYSSNFISRFIKRIILRIGYKIITKGMEDSEDDIMSPENLISLKGSYIYFKINDFLKGSDAPFEILNIKNYGHKLEVEGAARIPVPDSSTQAELSN